MRTTEDFNDLLWFLAVAEECSFTKAAAKLGIAQSTLSHTIKRLEAEMGIRLLTRTTRSVSLTDAGDRLRATLAPRISEIRTEIAALMSYRTTPAGRIRITLSDHAFTTLVWPKLAPVLSLYPDIQIEFSIDNGFSNIAETGFDAGVRLGESVQQGMIAVKIGPDARLLTVASPHYLANRTIPTHPQDLIEHRCINLRQSTIGSIYAWEYSKDEQDLRVRVEGQLTFNSMMPVVDAALAGHGIGFVPEDIVAHHIASGALTLLLDDWSPSFPGYYMYFPSRRQTLPAFRVVIDALRHVERPI